MATLAAPSIYISNYGCRYFIVRHLLQVIQMTFVLNH